MKVNIAVNVLVSVSVSVSTCIDIYVSVSVSISVCTSCPVSVPIYFEVSVTIRLCLGVDFRLRFQHRFHFAVSFGLRLRFRLGLRLHTLHYICVRDHLLVHDLNRLFLYMEIYRNKAVFGSVLWYMSIFASVSAPAYVCLSFSICIGMSTTIKVFVSVFFFKLRSVFIPVLVAVSLSISMPM